MFVKDDITNGDDTQKAINKIINRFGAVSVVVNCAGIENPGKLLGKDGDIHLAHFNKVIQINLTGT